MTPITTLRPILTIPNKILTTPSKPVTDFPIDPALIEEMFAIMHAAPGMGLAAPQIGLSIQLAVLEAGLTGERFIIVNPTITDSEGSALFEEGCLSIPKMRIPVRRALSIGIRYQTETGAEVNAVAENLTAQVLQHEIDHLEGTLIMQRRHF